MILSAHQVNFLPYLGFFHKLILSDIFVLLDDVQFVHTGPFSWMNRNKIRTKGGSQYITVPVYVKGRFGQKLNEVEINNQIDWRRKLLGALKQNYCKSQFFNDIYNNIEKITQKKYTSLIALNIDLLNFIFEYLEIDKLNVNIVYSSTLGIESKSTQRLVDLCKKFGATKYIAGFHGKDYLEFDLFNRENIQVIFQKFNPEKYVQQYSGFVPYLSVIDAIFNIGKETITLIRNSGSLT